MFSSVAALPASAQYSKTYSLLPMSAFGSLPVPSKPVPARLALGVTGSGYTSVVIFLTSDSQPVKADAPILIS